MSLSRVLIDSNGRQYSSDTFDRFGDDLCELLLSYLCFEDKFKFECLSKQWRRLVFNKVYHFDDRIFWSNHVFYCYYRDNKRLMTDHQMKTVLQKCLNVKTIKLCVNSETVPSLSLLSDNCHRLKSIELEVNQKVSFEAMLPFCQTLGSRVEELIIPNLLNKKELLPWLPNLKRMYGRKNIDWTLLVGNELVPTLNTLNRVNIGSHQMSAFVQLVDKYEKTLKNIRLQIGSAVDIDLIFKQLYRLNNLESIYLFRSHNPNLDIWFDLTPRIIELDRCCPKLSKVILNVRKIESNLSSKSWKTIKSLTIYCYEMSDNFFAILPELIPNLKEFSFTSDIIYTNEHLNCLSRMKDLKRLELQSYKADNHLIDDSAVIQLLDSCKNLKELNLQFGSNLTDKTIEELKELANNRHKQTIRFSTKGLKGFNCVGTEIPNNLSLVLN